MTKLNHTPGPWRANKYPTVFSGRNKHIAYIATDGISNEECEANIELIRAAPEMYEALRLFAEYEKAFDSDHVDAMIKYDQLRTLAYEILNKLEGTAR